LLDGFPCWIANILRVCHLRSGSKYHTQEFVDSEDQELAMAFKAYLSLPFAYSGQIFGGEDNGTILEVTIVTRAISGQLVETTTTEEDELYLWHLTHSLSEAAKISQFQCEELLVHRAVIASLARRLGLDEVIPTETNDSTWGIACSQVLERLNSVFSKIELDYPALDKTEISSKMN
jgi:hypothetical protein